MTSTKAQAVLVAALFGGAWSALALPVGWYLFAFLAGTPVVRDKGSGAVGWLLLSVAVTVVLVAVSVAGVRVMRWAGVARSRLVAAVAVVLPFGTGFVMFWGPLFFGFIETALLMSVPGAAVTAFVAWLASGV